MNKTTFKPQATYRPLSPRPIGILGYESIMTRLTKLISRTAKAVFVYSTTRCSWHLSWVQAEK